MTSSWLSYRPTRSIASRGLSFGARGRRGDEVGEPERLGPRPPRGWRAGRAPRPRPGSRRRPRRTPFPSAGGRGRAGGIGGGGAFAPGLGKVRSQRRLDGGELRCPGVTATTGRSTDSARRARSTTLNPPRVAPSRRTARTPSQCGEARIASATRRVASAPSTATSVRATPSSRSGSEQNTSATTARRLPRANAPSSTPTTRGCAFDSARPKDIRGRRVRAPWWAARSLRSGASGADGSSSPRAARRRSPSGSRARTAPNPCRSSRPATRRRCSRGRSIPTYILRRGRRKFPAPAVGRLLVALLVTAVVVLVGLAGGAQLGWGLVARSGRVHRRGSGHDLERRRGERPFGQHPRQPDERDRGGPDRRDRLRWLVLIRRHPGRRDRPERDGLRIRTCPRPAVRIVGLQQYRGRPGGRYRALAGLGLERHLPRPTPRSATSTGSSPASAPRRSSSGSRRPWPPRGPSRRTGVGGSRTRSPARGPRLAGRWPRDSSG